MRIIPAIDIIGGQCVRLSQGNYSKKTIYSNSPLDVAKSFEDAGIRYLHLVDLDGAKAKSIQNAAVLEQICANTKLKVDFGGGVRTRADVELALNCGAEQITAGSVAAKTPELVYEWLQDFGPEKVILGADVRETKIAVNGWEEELDLDVFEFVRIYQKKFVKTVISTDIATDGMLTGPSYNLYREMLRQCPGVDLVASGGVSQIEDIRRLKQLGVGGVIIGKAIYENRITLKELEDYVD